jgi:hypothetical protein
VSLPSGRDEMKNLLIVLLVVGQARGSTPARTSHSTQT